MRYGIVLFLALLAGNAALAGGGWVEKLFSDDPKTRDLAHRVLLRQGTPRLEELREAAAKATGEQRRATLVALIKKIEAREPFGLAFSAGMPKMRLTTALVNSDDFKFSVRVRNKGKQTVVLRKHIALKVLGPDGKELERTQRIGRGGLRFGGYLASIPFVTLEPNKTWSFLDGVKRYMHDPDWIVGWKVPGPGTYTLEFTYRFDRAALKKRAPNEEGIDDPQKPWNKAPEFKLVFRTTMRVDGPDARGAKG